MKRFGRVVATVLLSILVVLMLASCSRTTDNSIKVIMETTTEKWPAKIEKFCSLKDLGAPFGTAKEEYISKKDMREVRFAIDEEMTQTLVDGYAKGVWQACVTAGGGRPHSCNYYIYDNFKEACRQQEPLDYYIWYFFVNQKEYRLGLYPTMLEDGEPGGLVLRIEAW